MSNTKATWICGMILNNRSMKLKNLLWIRKQRKIKRPLLISTMSMNRLAWSRWKSKLNLQQECSSIKDHKLFKNFLIWIVLHKVKERFMIFIKNKILSLINPWWTLHHKICLKRLTKVQSLKIVEVCLMVL